MRELVSHREPGEVGVSAFKRCEQNKAALEGCAVRIGQLGDLRPLARWTEPLRNQWGGLLRGVGHGGQRFVLFEIAQFDSWFFEDSIFGDYQGRCIQPARLRATVED